VKCRFVACSFQHVKGIRTSGKNWGLVIPPKKEEEEEEKKKRK
jgi:hypothetical protein